MFGGPILLCSAVALVPYTCCVALSSVMIFNATIDFPMIVYLASVMAMVTQDAMTSFDGARFFPQ